MGWGWMKQIGNGRNISKTTVNPGVGESERQWDTKANTADI